MWSNSPDSAQLARAATAEFILPTEQPFDFFPSIASPWRQLQLLHQLDLVMVAPLPCRTHSVVVVLVLVSIVTIVVICTGYNPCRWLGIHRYWAGNGRAGATKIMLALTDQKFTLRKIDRAAFGAELVRRKILY